MTTTRVNEIITAVKLPEKSFLGDDASYGYDAEDMLAFAAACVERAVRQCADAADSANACRCKYPGDYIAEYMGFGEEEGAANWRAK